MALAPEAMTVMRLSIAAGAALGGEGGLERLGEGAQLGLDLGGLGRHVVGDDGGEVVGLGLLLQPADRRAEDAGGGGLQLVVGVPGGLAEDRLAGLGGAGGQGGGHEGCRR